MAKAKVQKVIDGDTFKTRDGEMIRLSGVNAPEKGKQGSPQATKDLRDLIYGEEVNMQPVAKDQYGRTVANVRVGNKSVNKAMKDKGWK